jgi:hypothetical protein
MAKRKPTSTGTGGTPVRAEQGDRTENASWPSVEEGLRLIHAFCEIKQATVREAIIRYVEEQSRLQKDR